MEENKQNKYNRSKVYKLIEYNSGFFYIGSTCNKLSQRLAQHKCDAKRYPEIPLYKKFNDLGWENISIVLVENCILNSKDDLHRAEDRVLCLNLSNEKCLNKYRSYLSTSEKEEKLKDYQHGYRKQHKEQAHEYYTEYYIKNKQIVNEKNKLLLWWFVITKWTCQTFENNKAPTS